MGSPIYGRVSAVKEFENRADIIVIDVNTHTDTGSGDYNVPLARVTLNGVPAAELADVVRFVTGYRNVRAEVSGARPDLAGTGYTPCEAIALTALE